MSSIMNNLQQEKSSLSLLLFEVSIGYIGLIGSINGLKRVILPQRTEQKVIEIAKVDGIYKPSDSSTFLGDLPSRISLYFQGKNVKFDDKVDYGNATDYQKMIWGLVRRIPYGHTITYGGLAEISGNAKAARAVGNVLARNPVPIVVPCHRVLSSDDSLGGFSGGLRLKKYLLKLESLDS